MPGEAPLGPDRSSLTSAGGPSRPGPHILSQPLKRPYGFQFGPDNNLYVCSGLTDEVLRYNGTTGAFMGAFVSAGSGGLSVPCSLTFAPDGDLYVVSWGTHQLKRYNGTTGAYIRTLDPGNRSGLYLLDHVLVH